MTLNPVYYEALLCYSICDNVRNNTQPQLFSTSFAQPPLMQPNPRHIDLIYAGHSFLCLHYAQWPPVPRLSSTVSTTPRACKRATSSVDDDAMQVKKKKTTGKRHHGRVTNSWNGRKTRGNHLPTPSLPAYHPYRPYRPTRMKRQQWLAHLLTSKGEHSFFILL